MNEVFTLEREFLFKTNIYEITSISIEPNYDIDSAKISGEFIISGSYRLHEISINKEDFMFKLPFKHELKSNINLDTVKLDINNFTYNFNNKDELSINVEYIVTAEEGIKVFEDENKLDEFLNNNEYDIVDLRDDIKVENEIKMPIVSDDTSIDTNNIDKDMIINSINGEDEYVLYHIHTVMMNDTIESITKKYNVSLNVLKDYNNFDNLELNMKLIIPNEEL